MHYRHPSEGWDLSRAGQHTAKGPSLRWGDECLMSEGGSRDDPQRNRCGCFRQDLTGLAMTTSARLPPRIWRNGAGGSSPYPTGPVGHVIASAAEALALRPVPGPHPAAGHAWTAIAAPARTTLVTAAMPAGATVPATSAIPTRSAMGPARPAIPAGAPAPAIMRRGFGGCGGGDAADSDQTGAQDSKKFHNALLPVDPPFGEHGRRMPNRR